MLPVREEAGDRQRVVIVAGRWSRIADAIEDRVLDDNRSSFAILGEVAPDSRRAASWRWAGRAGSLKSAPSSSRNSCRRLCSPWPGHLRSAAHPRDNSQWEICRRPWRSAGSRRSARRHTGSRYLAKYGQDPRKRSPENRVRGARSCGSRRLCRHTTGRACRPFAPGSHPSTWSKDRFSIMSTTTVSKGASVGAGSELLVCERQFHGMVRT